MRVVGVEALLFGACLVATKMQPMEETAAVLEEWLACMRGVVGCRFRV